LFAILLVMFREERIAVIKKYGNMAGKIKVSQRLMPSKVSEEKPFPNDKISEIATRKTKKIKEKKVFTFLTIIYCIMA